MTLPSLPARGAIDWYAWAEAVHAVAATVVPRGAFPQPPDQGMVAWAYDPAQAVNTANNALASGVLTLIKVRLSAPATVASVLLQVTTGGSGLTAGQCLAGLYDSTGALVASTADQAAAWASTGVKTMALTAAAGRSLTLLPAGIYYVALLAVGTTMPTLVRASGQAAINAGLVAGAYRFGTYGTAQTALPATLPLAGMGAGVVATWAALA